jgi:MFS family permease
VLSWPWLLAVRFYHGLATAIYAPPASALVAKVYPKQRGSRLGLYSAAENAGVVLGPVLGGVVLTVLTFDEAFLVSGVIGALALLTMLRVPNDRVTSAPTTGQRRGLGQALRGLASGVRRSSPTRRSVWSAWSRRCCGRASARCRPTCRSTP